MWDKDAGRCMEDRALKFTDESNGQLESVLSGNQNKTKGDTELKEFKTEQIEPVIVVNPDNVIIEKSAEEEQYTEGREETAPKDKAASDKKKKAAQSYKRRKVVIEVKDLYKIFKVCLLYTSPSPRD